MALGVAPMFLRLALAGTFIWAGLGKIQATMEVSGEDAAVLANMGVISPGAGGGPVDPLTPSAPLPPAGEPDAKQTPGNVNDSQVHAPLESMISRVSQESTAGAPAGSSPGAGTGTHTAADFPEPVPVARVYGLALMLHKAAHVLPDEHGVTPAPLWPPALASGRLPVIFAYMVVAAELGGGLLVLIGLCTRFGAFALAGTMVGAIWLTQIGPAVQSGVNQLGFLPAHDVWAVKEWTPFAWQFALLCAALALMFAGPGFMALDHAFFGRRRRHDDHDGE